MPGKLTGRTALVTGASIGIGYELARLCAEDGCRLILVARSGDRLEEVAGEFEREFGTESRILVKDLTDEAAAAELVDDLNADDITVDILINNAGVGDYGLFAESDADRQLNMVRLNIVSLLYLTRLLLPGMIERRWGRVLNLASTAAFVPGPLMATYYASKAFVLSFSLALSNELSGTGVTATVLCPGPTETGFQKASNVEGTRLFRGSMTMQARPVAKDGYRAMVKGKAMIVSGARNKVIAFMTRFAPKVMLSRIARKLQEPAA